MKKNAMILMILSLFVSMGYSQSENYEKAMMKNLEKMDAAESPDDMQNAANKFERIAMAEKDQWLPWYYAAYASALKGYMGLGPDQLDQQLDKAQELLDKASELDANNDEIEVLQGFIYQARIQVDPQSRGQQYSMKANAAFAKASQINPDNPRPDFLIAQNLLYTPEAFGGGKEAACAKYQSAAEKFANFNPESDIAPNWGKEMNEQMMNRNCK